MPEINLLHTDSATSESDYGVVARVVAKLLTFFLALVVLIFILLFGYNWYNNNQLGKVEAKIKAAEAAALKNEDRNELVTRQEQLGHLEKLIDSHVYWSYLLPEMARVTLKSAKYTEIEAKSDGTLNLVVNLPNYEEIEKYMQIFDLPEYNKQFSNVKIISINTVGNEGALVTQLRLELTFDPQYIKGRR